MASPRRSLIRRKPSGASDALAPGDRDLPDGERVTNEANSGSGFEANLEVIDHHMGERFHASDRDDGWDFDEPVSEEVRKDARFYGGEAPPGSEPDADPEPEASPEVEAPKPDMARVGLGIVALLGSGGLVAAAGVVLVALLGLGGAGLMWLTAVDPTSEPVAAENPESKPVPVVVEEPPPVEVEAPVLEPEPEPVPAPARPRRPAPEPPPEPIVEAPEPEPLPPPPAQPVPETDPPKVEGPTRRGLFGGRKK